MSLKQRAYATKIARVLLGNYNLDYNRHFIYSTIAFRDSMVVVEETIHDKIQHTTKHPFR